MPTVRASRGLPLPEENTRDTKAAVLRAGDRDVRRAAGVERIETMGSAAVPHAVTKADLNQDRTRPVCGVGWRCF